jgi:hypothetical protein
MRRMSPWADSRPTFGDVLVEFRGDRGKAEFQVRPQLCRTPTIRRVRRKAVGHEPRSALAGRYWSNLRVPNHGAEARVSFSCHMRHWDDIQNENATFEMRIDKRCRFSHFVSYRGTLTCAECRTSHVMSSTVCLTFVSIFQSALFLPDVTLLNRRINQGGGQSTFTVAEGGFHVYVGVPLDTGGEIRTRPCGRHDHQGRTSLLTNSPLPSADPADALVTTRAKPCYQ